MIKRLAIVAGMGLALSGAAFATGTSAEKKAGSAPGDSAAAAIAQCDKLTGAEKATCLQQARESTSAGRAATGATSSGASGRAGSATSPSNQPSETAPGKTGSPSPSRAY